MKPSMAAPAPASMSSVRAIWPAISALWVRRSRRPAGILRVADCIAWAGIGAGGCRAGKRPKSRAGGDGKRDAKEQHREVDTNRGLMGKGGRRKVGDNDAERLVSQQNAEGSSGERQQQAIP